MYLEVVGWIGAVAFAICGLPQAIKCMVDGHATGIAASFLALWLIGEICSLVYILPIHKYPLIFNYIFNICFILVMAKYKIWPRRKTCTKKRSLSCQVN